MGYDLGGRAGGRVRGCGATKPAERPFTKINPPFFFGHVVRGIPLYFSKLGVGLSMRAPRKGLESAKKKGGFTLRNTNVLEMSSKVQNWSKSRYSYGFFLKKKWQ